MSLTPTGLLSYFLDLLLIHWDVTGNRSWFCLGANVWESFVWPTRFPHRDRHRLIIIIFRSAPDVLSSEQYMCCHSEKRGVSTKTWFPLSVCNTNTVGPASVGELGHKLKTLFPAPLLSRRHCFCLNHWEGVALTQAGDQNKPKTSVSCLLRRTSSCINRICFRHKWNITLKWGKDGEQIYIQYIYIRLKKCSFHKNNGIMLQFASFFKCTFTFEFSCVCLYAATPYCTFYFTRASCCNNNNCRCSDFLLNNNWGLSPPDFHVFTPLKSDSPTRLSTPPADINVVMRGCWLPELRDAFSSNPC